MDSESEINIEDIEAEIGSRRKAVAGLLVVFALLLIAQIEAEHAERDMKRHILHDKHLHARREIKARLHHGGVGGARFAVVRPAELAVARSEAELHFIEYAETSVARQADLLVERGGGGIFFRAINDVVQIEIHVVVDIHLE